MNESLELVITNTKGVNITTSLIIAQIFMKEHKHVLRDIEQLTCSQEFRQSNFGLSSYFSSQNKELPMFEVTKDGFSFLVMGYTGEKASQFKETFIREFNKREAFLKDDDYIIYRAFEISKKRYEIAEAKILQQQKYIEMIKPQAEIAVQFVLADGCDSIGNVAKMLGYGPNTFFEILRERKILQKDPPNRNVPYSQYINAKYFELRKAFIDNRNKTVKQTWVTARGKVWLQRQLKKTTGFQGELNL